MNNHAIKFITMPDNQNDSDSGIRDSESSGRRYRIAMSTLASSLNRWLSELKPNKRHPYRHLNRNKQGYSSGNLCEAEYKYRGKGSNRLQKLGGSMELSSVEIGSDPKVILSRSTDSLRTIKVEVAYKENLVCIYNIAEGEWDEMIATVNKEIEKSGHVNPSVVFGIEFVYQGRPVRSFSEDFGDDCVRLYLSNQLKELNEMVSYDTTSPVQSALSAAEIRPESSVSAYGRNAEDYGGKTVLDWNFFLKEHFTVTMVMMLVTMIMMTFVIMSLFQSIRDPVAANLIQNICYAFLATAIVLKVLKSCFRTQ